MKQSLVILGIIALFLIGFIFFFLPYGAEFSTLEHARTFAQTMPEYPEIDNTDWYKPDYTSFFREKDASLFNKMLYKLGLAKPYWAPESFKQLLIDVAQERSQKGYTGDFVQKMYPPTGTKFIIWGNLQGAFHSLVRDLTELQKKGIVDNNLHIVDPTYYFVFDGNVISRSPYSLETLALVVQLMKMNPEQVIYIRGTHEDDQYWDGFEMSTELKIRLWYEVQRHTPLASFIDQFFETLPHGVYLVADETEQTIDLVRFSNEPGQKLFNELRFASFFSRAHHDTVFDLSQTGVPSQKKVRLKVQIVSNHYKPNYYLTEGLRMLTPDNGSTVWTVLSAPTSSYKNRFNFDNDAFALLTVQEQLDEWTIGLCKQSTQDFQGFDCSSVFNLLLGFPLDQQFKYERSLTVGSTMDLTMGLQGFNESLEDGLQASLQDQNMQGGVNGTLLRLIIRDDGYNPARARKNVETFLKENIDILLIPHGTQTLKAYVELIREKRLLVLFPIAGGRKDLLEYLIFFRPSYHTEGKVITEYALDKAKARKFVFFYPNDEFGRSIMRGARETLEARGVTTYLEVEYKRNILEFKVQAEKIIDYNPDTLAFFCIPSAATELINQIGINNLAVDTLIGVSDLTSNVFRQYLANNGLHMILPTVVPNPKTSHIELVKEYRDSMERNRVDVNTNSLEGYIVGRIFIEALKKIGSAITKEAIVNALEAMKDYQLDGFPLSFSPETRELSQNLWIATLPEQENVEWELYNLQESQA